MSETLSPDLRTAERARRATRNAAIAALAAFAMERREDFERFLADDGEAPDAFMERWIETWADAYRLRRAVIAEFGLVGDSRIATQRAYGHVAELLKFIAEDMGSVRDDAGEFGARLRRAGLHWRQNGRGYIDPSPLAEQLFREEVAAALRGLIETGALPLNRRGAAGWRVGNDLWLVGKRVVEALRTHPLFTGQDGLPTDNARLLDLLLSHCLVTPTPEGRPIWRVTVKIDGQTDSLSLLRLAIDHVWARTDDAPPGESTATVETGTTVDQYG